MLRRSLVYLPHMDGPFYTVPPGVQMFPDPTTVFTDRLDQHMALLFPIFSIDLSIIDPAWKGHVHMLLYNYDPYNQSILSTFTDYCKDNSLGFDVKEAKYRFQTSFSFFDLTDEWKEWFERTRTGFEATRDHYRLNGEITTTDREERLPLLDQLGGEPDWIQNDETPLDPDGKPMRFIAKVSSYYYTDDMCGRVHYLFYSNAHQLAVIVDQCD